jgi:hypothetical protein
VVDLQDVAGGAGAPLSKEALLCDRTIFTSLPSRIGEGYRLVAWSPGLRPEERQELTRRAPSHGSLTGDAELPRGLILFRLQASGRTGWGFTRVAGAEHTRRGGGRVWTDFLLGDAADVARQGFHPNEVHASLAAAAPLKPPLGTSPLPRVGITRIGSGAAALRGERGARVAAATASLLLAGQPCVIAAGVDAPDLLEDALRMIPGSLRSGIEACAGFRFSPSRGVKVTITDRIDQDALRATRGQGVACVDLEKQMPAMSGPLATWLALMTRWWNEERAVDAVELADRLGAGWTVEEITRVATLCEAIDRGEERPDRLDELLLRRSAA